jgi:hypothetical protein
LISRIRDISGSWRKFKGNSRCRVYHKEAKKLVFLINLKMVKEVLHLVVFVREKY